MLKRLAALAIFCMAFLLPLWVDPGWGQDKHLDGRTDTARLSESGAGPWQIEAATISYEQEAKVYQAEGNVRVYSGDQSLEADWARLDLEGRKVELRGNVRLKYGKDWLEGNHVFWNIATQTGTVDEGIVYFSANHFYVKGKAIEKTGLSEYALEDGYVTSCDPSRPDWKLKYGKMKVDIGGIASAKSISFWARDLPLIYFPFIAFPVEVERKSGFLVPWAGYSELQGVEAELPYFWAIREDMDATFYARYMVERGFMGGAEFRITNEKWGEGLWMFNYLRDQAGKEHLAIHDYPYQTRDRYWLRSKHSIELPEDIEVRLDLDFPSDRNFLKEFEKGSASYGFSEKSFREMLGRGIVNDQYALSRESTLYADKRWESSALGLDVRYWHQLDDDLDEFTLQRLPALSFQTVPESILHSPFYYTLDSSAVNYWRNEGDRGGRWDLYPRVYYPLHWKSYVNVEPSIGGRFTGYSLEWDETPQDSYQDRFLGDVRVEASSRLNRVYDLKLGEYEAVQHSIRPEIRYAYVSEGTETDHLPQFDRTDQNQFYHNVSYGFTNILTSRKVVRDAEGNAATSYQEFARVRIFNSFNIEPLPEDIRFLPETGRGFSTAGMRVDFMPQKYVTLSYDTLFYSTDEEEGNHDVFLTLDSGKGHAVRFNYQYRKDEAVNEFITEATVKVTPSIYLSSYHDYSLEQQDMFKQGYGVRYFSGCWGLGLSYEKEDDDQRIAFSVSLLGLGSLGTKFSYGGDDFLKTP